MRWLSGLLLSCLLLSGNAARADIGDCEDASYLPQFKLSGRDLTGETCKELFRLGINTPAGDRVVRGVMLQDAAPLSDDTIGGIERGVKQAAAALETVPGDWDIHDVTVLVLDEEYRVTTLADGEQLLGGVTFEPTRAASKECHIALFLQGMDAESDRFALIAHEMFHCLQYATLHPTQMETAWGSGTWWIEGSAVLFSAVAVPESAITAETAQFFNAGVQAGRALDEMGYGGSVFFFWRYQEHGFDGLIDMLTTMPGTPGQAAQQDAMRRILAPGEWLKFAQAYVDSAILHPGGHDMFLDSTWDAQVFDITQTGTRIFQVRPFVLMPGSVNYDCAKWMNRVFPEDVNLAVRLADGTAWQPWANETDARTDGSRIWRLVAMETRDGETTVKHRATRLENCAPCQGSAKVDMCLVGGWEMDSRPIVEFMRRVGAPITHNNMGAMYLQVNEDGTYRTSTTPIDFGVIGIEPDGDDILVDVTGTAGASLGRWSIIAPGQLAGCTDLVDSTTADIAYTSPEVSGNSPAFFPGANGEEGTVTYTCGPDRFSTRVRMGRFGDVEFPFIRLTPPPEEE